MHSVVLSLHGQMHQAAHLKPVIVIMLRVQKHAIERVVLPHNYVECVGIGRTSLPAAHMFLVVDHAYD